MDTSIALDVDIYEPNTDIDGNYADYIPSSRCFINGLRCPCGARKDHIFNSKPSFASHTKSKTHIKWVSDMNSNKHNYYAECERLKELVNSQKLIIAKLEKDVYVKLKTIDYLTNQLMQKDVIAETDLLQFD